MGRWRHIILLFCLPMGAAHADVVHRMPPPRSSVHLGIVVGDPWFYPYYPRPLYWPPPVVVPVAPVVVEPPPIYIERPDNRPQGVPLEPGYWYYCPEKNAYYPQAPSCESGWVKIPPRASKQE